MLAEADFFPLVYDMFLTVVPGQGIPQLPHETLQYVASEAAVKMVWLVSVGGSST